MLHFKAPEIPPHWLSFDSSDGSEDKRICLLLDQKCDLRLFEDTDSAHLLRGLKTGTYKLALIMFYKRKVRGKLRGCVWILRRNVSTWVRSGVVAIELDLFFGPVSSQVLVEKQIAENLLSNMVMLSRSAPHVQREVS